MKANTCPHCGHSPAVPLWRKSTLGPAVTTRCRACNHKVSVSWVSLLTLLPMFGVIGLTSLSNGIAAKAALWAVALVLGYVLQWKFVPLVKR
jgi:hypothetical protein